MFTSSRQFLITSTVLCILISSIRLLLTGLVDASDPSKYLLGVQPDRRSFFEFDEGRNFKCLDGSGSIPWDFVNDDYCDCRDASDEPGTSACPHGRFYCQNKGFIHRLIPSAWVNDGQCDCCDASDEYNSTVKCENTCGVLGENYRREQERIREIADKGSAIRSQYKEQAKQRKEQNTQLLEQYKRELSEKESAIKQLEEELNSDFGPANVFFPLKGQCFNYKDREYTYHFCPFTSVSQQQDSSPHNQIQLGRWAGWAGPSDNLYSAQKYEDGVSCWNGPSRSALIKIECGVEDKITSVSEPAKCEYVYTFITPAACPDTDPPEEQPVTETTEQQDVTASPDQVTSSLEVEDDSLEADASNYFPDEHNEAPDGHGSSHEEKHDEL